MLDIGRPQVLVRALDALVECRGVYSGFYRAYVTSLVSVVREYGGFLEEDIDYVLGKEKMWAYGKMKEEHRRQVMERGEHCSMQVAR